MGQLFGVALAPHNRWGGFKLLRESWPTHVEATRCRPALLVDEAQEMPAAVLAELRILAATDFDSRSILTVVLCGDGRLTQQFRSEELLPIASRIRARLTLDYLTPKELLDWLEHAVAAAGNPRLLTPEVKTTTLAEHATGNLRVLTTLGNDLLALAVHRQLSQIDQQLYLEVFTSQPRPKLKPQPPTAKHPRS